MIPDKKIAAVQNNIELKKHAATFFEDPDHVGIGRNGCFPICGRRQSAEKSGFCHEKAECGIKNRALQPVGHGVEADSWRPVL